MKKNWITFAVVALILVSLVATSETTVYGQYCRAWRFTADPYEAMLEESRTDANRYGINRDCAEYTARLDESNALCCFSNETGILFVQTWVKGDKFHHLGYTAHLIAGRDDMPENGSILWDTISLIREDGRFEGTCRIAFVFADREVKEAYDKSYELSCGEYHYRLLVQNAK